MMRDSASQIEEAIVGRSGRTDLWNITPLTPALSTNPGYVPVPNTPSPRPSPPVGERVSAGRVRGRFRDGEHRTPNVQHPTSNESPGRAPLDVRC